jgi:hypothetical protein
MGGVAERAEPRVILDWPEHRVSGRQRSAHHVSPRFTDSFSYCSTNFGASLTERHGMRVLLGFCVLNLASIDLAHMTAAPITSAGRFSPWRPLGMSQFLGRGRGSTRLRLSTGWDRHCGLFGGGLLRLLHFCRLRFLDHHLLSRAQTPHVEHNSRHEAIRLRLPYSN